MKHSEGRKQFRGGQKRGDGGTNLGHLFQFAADQFSDARALLSAQHISIFDIKNADQISSPTAHQTVEDLKQDP
ncbi:hypothetical protein LXL04_019667 [Taraxacum kok-saghyz]